MMIAHVGVDVAAIARPESSCAAAAVRARCRTPRAKARSPAASTIPARPAAPAPETPPHPPSPRTVSSSRAAGRAARSPGTAGAGSHTNVTRILSSLAQRQPEPRADQRAAATRGLERHDHRRGVGAREQLGAQPIVGRRRPVAAAGAQLHAARASRAPAPDETRRPLRARCGTSACSSRSPPRRSRGSPRSNRQHPRRRSIVRPAVSRASLRAGPRSAFVAFRATAAADRSGRSRRARGSPSAPPLDRRQVLLSAAARRTIEPLGDDDQRLAEIVQVPSCTASAFSAEIAICVRSVSIRAATRPSTSVRNSSAACRSPRRPSRLAMMRRASSDRPSGGSTNSESSGFITTSRSRGPSSRSTNCVNASRARSAPAPGLMWYSSR